MGTGRYKFENGSVKTATEVISDKSDLYQSRQRHCISISTAILNMVRIISFLDTGVAVDATVDFDDSIIEDSNATIDKNIKLVQADSDPSYPQSWRSINVLRQRLRRS